MSPLLISMHHWPERIWSITRVHSKFFFVALCVASNECSSGNIEIESQFGLFYVWIKIKRPLYMFNAPFAIPLVDLQSKRIDVFANWFWNKYKRWGEILFKKNMIVIVKTGREKKMLNGCIANFEWNLSHKLEYWIF